MSEMAVGSVKGSDYPITVQPEKVEVIDYIPETKPDSFEKAPQKTHDVTTKIMVGTMGSVAGYKTAKGFANKVIGFIGKEAKEVAADFGKTIKVMPPKVAGIIKWSAIAAGTVFAGILATKDTNRDGRLDVLDAMSNFFKPL